MNRRFALLALWAVLMAPLAMLWWQAASPDADLDALVADTGNWAMAWLAIAVVMTPLAKLGRPLARLLWLRRAVGLAAFAASVVHLWLYVLAMRGFAEPGGEWALMADEAMTPGILTGWIALALMLPPALASNDAAMRLLRRAWKPVQRLAWPAAAVALAHMAVVHDAGRLAMAITGLVAGLQLVRFFPATRKV
ncbi:ferric reductase-like transmembrane domain-containing protein [Sandarakinorhabdus sp. AAP62]|uniref:ferric reductase-like transmembrane domain-containing protein n=1 Tax=Sandarakinorhabdus sp. AAP62 TaxID=1248916 RepID=UPI0002DCBB44|nr:ferric reductase-like transmembrane domain-containing protein [Sandarakinorhabdus sp. AAP62]